MVDLGPPFEGRWLGRAIGEAACSQGSPMRYKEDGGILAPGGYE